MELKQYSTGDLKREIERRTNLKKPEAIENPDLTGLHEVCQSYIDFVGSKDYYEDNDYDGYIYEQALSTLYGKDVWEWINKNV